MHLWGSEGMEGCKAAPHKGPLFEDALMCAFVRKLLAFDDDSLVV